MAAERLAMGAPPRGRAAALPAATLIAAVALAAALGTAYALAAYEVDPSVVPVVAATAAAVGLGLWRLEYGLALVVIATPFAENADIGQAKIRIALICWVAILVAVQVARATLSDARLERPPLFYAALGFGAAAFVSLWVAGDQAAALGKVLGIGGSILLFLLVALFLTEWDRLRPLLIAILLVGLLIGAHTAFQYFTGDVSRVGFVSESGAVEYRVTSFFPHPNQLAGFMLLLVPFAGGMFAAFRSPAIRLLCVGVIALGCLAIVVTFSRGALVALLVLPVLFIRDRRSWPLIAAMLVALAVATPGVWKDRVAEAGKTDRPEIATRLDFWAAAGQMFGENPVAGVGVDNFPVAYLGLERPGRTFLGGGFFSPPMTAHNLYLNVAAEQGLLGLTALAVLILAFAKLVLTLRGSPDRRVRALGGGLAGAGLALLAHNAFDVTFTDAKTGTLAWILIGVAAALGRMELGRRASAGAAP